MAERGYLTTDINDEYLTDSINFRLYVGKYDEEDERFEYRFKNDSVKVILTSKAGLNPNFSQWKILKVKRYSLAELKKRHRYD